MKDGGKRNWKLDIKITSQSGACVFQTRWSSDNLTNPQQPLSKLRGLDVPGCFLGICSLNIHLYDPEGLCARAGRHPWTHHRSARNRKTSLYVQVDLFLFWLFLDILILFLNMTSCRCPILTINFYSEHIWNVSYDAFYYRITYIHIYITLSSGTIRSHMEIKLGIDSKHL